MTNTITDERPDTLAAMLRHINLYLDFIDKLAGNSESEMQQDIERVAKYLDTNPKMDQRIITDVFGEDVPND